MNITGLNGTVVGKVVRTPHGSAYIVLGNGESIPCDMDTEQWIDAQIPAQPSTCPWCRPALPAAV